MAAPQHHNPANKSILEIGQEIKQRHEEARHAENTGDIAQALLLERLNMGFLGEHSELDQIKGIINIKKSFLGVCRRQADALLDAKDYAAAVSILKELLEQQERMYPLYHEDVVETRFDLVSALRQSKQIVQAVEVYREILNTSLENPEHVSLDEIAKTRRDIAYDEFDLKRYFSALELFQTNLDLYKNTLKNDDEANSTKEWIEKCKSRLKDRSKTKNENNRPAKPSDEKSREPDPGTNRTKSQTRQQPARKSLDVSTDASAASKNLLTLPETLSQQGRLRSHSDTDLKNKGSHGKPVADVKGRMFSASNGQKVNEAKEWIEELERRSQELLSTLDKRSGFEPTRIAILDTGIDGTHASFASKRIRAYKSWVSPEQDAESGIGFQARKIRGMCIDADGHGTHATDLLLRVDPQALVYVARVAEDRLPSAEIAAEAIRHAVEKWHVDIISMSFGFQKTPEDLSNAILEARMAKVLVFAAASNDGLKEDVFYPARDSNVICVGTTDAWGNRWKQSPDSMLNGTIFATLGVSVPAAWPNNSKSSAESGSSVSTPIVAGIASVLINVARQGSINPSYKPFMSQCANKLKEPDGMKALFKKISNGSGGFRALIPNSFGSPSDAIGPRDYIEPKIVEVIDQIYRLQR